MYNGKLIIIIMWHWLKLYNIKKRLVCRPLRNYLNSECHIKIMHILGGRDSWFGNHYHAQCLRYNGHGVYCIQCYNILYKSKYRCHSKAHDLITLYVIM